MVSRRVGALALLVSLVVVTAACGAAATSSPEVPAASSPAASSPAASAEAPTVLNVLSTKPEPQDVMAKWSQTYPNIQVKWENLGAVNVEQTLRTRFAGGGVGLDVVNAEAGYWPEFMSKGLFADITGESFLKNYTDETNASSTYDGKVYGISMFVHWEAVYYNKDLFDQYNLAPPTNWTEFMSVCKTLKSNGVAPLTFGAKDGWRSTLLTGLVYSDLLSKQPDWYTQVKEGKAKWTDPDSLAAIDKVQSLVEEGCIIQGETGLDYNSSYQAFYSGKAAMFPDGLWAIADLINPNKPSFQFGAFPMPADPGTQVRVPYTTGDHYGIAATSPNKDAGLKFLAFISQPDVATMLSSDFKSFSGVKGVDLAFDPLVEIVLPITQYPTDQMPYAYISSGVQTAMSSVWQKMLTGGITSADAAAALQAAQVTGQ